MNQRGEKRKCEKASCQNPRPDKRSQKSHVSIDVIHLISHVILILHVPRLARVKHQSAPVAPRVCAELPGLIKESINTFILGQSQPHSLRPMST